MNLKDRMIEAVDSLLKVDAAQSGLDAAAADVEKAKEALEGAKLRHAAAKQEVADAKAEYEASIPDLAGERMSKKQFLDGVASLKAVFADLGVIEAPTDAEGEAKAEETKPKKARQRRKSRQDEASDASAPENDDDSEVLAEAAPASSSKPQDEDAGNVSETKEPASAAAVPEATPAEEPEPIEINNEEVLRDLRDILADHAGDSAVVEVLGAALSILDWHSVTVARQPIPGPVPLPLTMDVIESVKNAPQPIDVAATLDRALAHGEAKLAQSVEWFGRVIEKLDRAEGDIPGFRILEPAEEAGADSPGSSDESLEAAGSDDLDEDVAPADAAADGGDIRTVDSIDEIEVFGGESDHEGEDPETAVPAAPPAPAPVKVTKPSWLT